MGIIQLFLSSVVSIIAIWYILPRIFNILKKKGIIVRNYLGYQVVTGMGLAFVFPCILSIIPLFIHKITADYLAFLAVVISLTLLGIIDDLLGDGTVKGLKGHIIAIIRGDLSTGGIKLIIATAVGTLISFFYHANPAYWFLYTLLFLLFINFINLLDLRPGRAIKTFLILMFPLLLLGRFEYIWIFIPLMASIPFYLKGEMKEQYMLGDTGANLMGGILGFLSLCSMKVAPLL
jgi:UDP-GlcNAc:undecaprenyl-phosphate GlcNAc-1-phosphate transferase